MYRPVWSNVILAELEYEQAAKLVRRGDDPTDADRRAAYLVQQMRHAFNDAEITGWEGLEGTYGLPDPDDEHVLAAAVVAGAGAIITLNTKDFPAALLPFRLETLRPAVFAANTGSLDPPRALHAIQAIANRTDTRGPTRTVTELLDILVRQYGFDDAVDQLRNIQEPKPDGPDGLPTSAPGADTPPVAEVEPKDTGKPMTDQAAIPPNGATGGRAVTQA